MSYNSIDASKTHRFLVTLGGPLQTMITGILGLALIRIRRNERFQNGLKLWYWLAIFLSLFWLREVFNLVMSVGNELVYPDGLYFGGDEAEMAWHLGLPLGTFAFLFGILGLLVGLYVVFKIVPDNLRLTFITGGFFGGILGFIIWMNHLGPILLP
ncbi:hypothetical protein LVD13_01920 [Flavobacteriaceae bacterium D16]|nr:hypothetical protein [Flavobacteriaceae bacterium D16]